MNVINIRKAPVGWEKNPRYVYIGRAGKGFEGYFGSPIEVSTSVNKRQCPMCGQFHFHTGSTLPCYELYLVNRLKTDPTFNHRFYYELTGRTLVCFCKPKPCHGDIILKYLSPFEDVILIENE